MDDLTKEFLVESREGLDRMERCLTELESKPGDAALLAEIFRAVHTIKGTTGFLGLPRLERLAHAGEYLLGNLRDGKLRVTSHIIDGLLALLDGLSRVLKLLEETGGEGTRTGDDDEALIAVLDDLREGGTGEAARADAKARSEVSGLVAMSVTPERSPQGSPNPSDHTLRVDVETLNRMMNQVGELVLTRNQIVKSSGGGEQFQFLARRLDGVTADLRETVMRARTQPVGQVFQKFPRMVRDLAQSCGRCVRLDFSGQETRLDKSLLEALKDPITHAIRNAVDHGIEPPAMRVKSGKALEGVLRLSAYHEGGQVVIEVSDDGAGIHKDRVLERAVERGLISAARGRAMSEQEVFQLIFEPGFSTNNEVTLVSGRGVGMDVVRANVESVGGVVELDSSVGEGTTLRMRVPLTLAIVPALVVSCGGLSFAIPRSAVGELLVVTRREESQLVQKIGDVPMLRLRDELLPLVSLNDLLELPKIAGNGYYVAVVEAKGKRFGLMVDDLLEPQEIVVKPLARLLRGIGVFSGASVLGNGELALILDIAGVSAKARFQAQESASGYAGREADVAETKTAATDTVTMLVYEGQRGERTAISLEAVERVERVLRSSIEYCGGAALLQHRGGLLPLEDEAGLLLAGEDGETVTVVICKRPGGGNVGLVVRKVMDIAAGQAPKQALTDHGPQGAWMTLVQQRVASVRQEFQSDLFRNDLREAA